MPKFRGDIDAYLNLHLTYPTGAAQRRISGRVIVDFIVDETGAVKNPYVFKSADYELDAEALRVVRSMPGWVPGNKDGKNVPAHYLIPIAFWTRY